MARRRLPFALIWPTGLVVLVGVLAFFQYKWLGQVSESERDRLRTTLNQRAREFADDFDREIARAYTSLQVNEDTVARRDWDGFGKQYDQWKEGSRFPQLIRNIFITADPDSGLQLLQFDPGARTFREASWPPELKPVKDRIQPFTNHIAAPPQMMGAIKFVAMAGSPIVASVPALLLPIQTTQPRLTSPRPDMLSFRLGPSYVVLELDRAFIVNTMLPMLVERHFAVDDYHVAITEARSPDTTIYTKGVAAGTAIREKEADASTAFFGVRVDNVRDAVAAMRPTSVSGVAISGTPPSTLSATANGRFSIVVQDSRGAMEATRTTNILYGGGAWQIALQHPAGSLEVAVSRARIRNLSLSFGVLAVLTVGVFLISINAQRAQRLAAQQMDFVATVSHELRTPLAVIRSAAQNLSAGVVHEPAQAKRYGDLIDAEGRRLTDMIEQVLTYAGLSDAKASLAKTPVDVAALTSEIVKSCVETCRPLARTEGFSTIDITTQEGLPEVSLDEGAFRRALNNLVVNAFKYGQGDAWLGVEVKRGADKNGRAEVQVAVSDGGPGIDPADLPHIFEAFYRGHDAKAQQIHGNGLGLSLVKGIAEAHGGRVTVKSTPGAGATFTLHLPA